MDSNLFTACEEGDLIKVQSLCKQNNPNPIYLDYNHAFCLACHFGHLKVAQWLYSQKNIDLHHDDKSAFNGACLRNHLEVAEWIYSLGEIDSTAKLQKEDICFAIKGAQILQHRNIVYWLTSLLIKGLTGQKEKK